MYYAPASQSYNWKQILRSSLIKAWLLGLLSLSACFQGSQVREDSNITSFSKLRPIDVDTSTAQEIGQEALDKIGYNRIIKLSEKAGFVEYRSSFSIQLVSYDSVVPTGFVSVFSRYALAAGVTSQADSPLPASPSSNCRASIYVFDVSWWRERAGGHLSGTQRSFTEACSARSLSARRLSCARARRTALIEHQGW